MSVIRSDRPDVAGAPWPAAGDRGGVAVILVNFRGAADTIACLDSLMKLYTAGVDVIVVENGSGDGSGDALQAWGRVRLPQWNEIRRSAGQPPLPFLELSCAEAQTTAGENACVPAVTLIGLDENLGFAGGNNVGLRLALRRGRSFFWLLNNDTEVSPDALDALLERMRRPQVPPVGLCGSTLVYDSDPRTIQVRGGNGFIPLKGRGYAIAAGEDLSSPFDPGAVEAQLRYVNGASMLVSRAFLETVGLMEEGYFLYFEEIDWAERGKGRFALGYAPGSVVRHKVGASIGTRDSGEQSPLADYYMTRNRIRFCRRFSPVSLPFVAFDVLRAVVRQLANGNPARAGLILRAAFGRPFRPVAGEAGRQ